MPLSQFPSNPPQPARGCRVACPVRECLTRVFRPAPRLPAPARRRWCHSRLWGRSHGGPSQGVESCLGCHWALEGSRHCGLGLARRLTAQGEQVAETDSSRRDLETASTSIRPRRQSGTTQSATSAKSSGSTGRAARRWRATSSSTSGQLQSRGAGRPRGRSRPAVGLVLGPEVPLE